MAYTESNMLPLGTEAPGFSLPDTISGNILQFSDIAGEKATVVMFLCNHCPYVIHVNPEIVNLSREYLPKGVGFVGISSNDADAYPEDGPEAMRQQAQNLGYPFPYLYDETQETARTYDAACTPDFYVFDGERRLVYRGQLDGSRPKRNDIPVTGEDLRRALDAVLAGNKTDERQRPSGGCNIKWKQS